MTKLLSRHLVWDNLNKNVYSVAIDDSGKFYTSAPTVTFSDPDSLPGTLATATATIANDRVSTLTLSNVGAGYTSAPTVIMQSIILLLLETIRF